MDVEDLVFYNIIYFLFAFFLVFPPNEIIQLGFSIPGLFGSWLGSEQMCFIHYHIIRISLTFFIHSLIPTGYYLFMGLCMPELALFDFYNLNLAWKIYFSISLSIFIGVATLVYYWSLNDYENHPIPKKLKMLSRSWKQVANDINIEFRHIDKFSRGTLFNRIYLTTNWIIKVTLYDLNICNNSNVELMLTHSTEVTLTQDGSPSIQFLNILVKPLNNNGRNFYIHLNSLEYKDFTDKLSAPISEASNIVIKQSLPDQFLDSFRDIVLNNPHFEFKREEIDSCIGCMRKEADVKLVRQCTDLDSDECKKCYCKPMWCLECLGKWFAYRQDQNQPNTWLSSKATCATCRATFCLLDVCPVELID